MAIKHYHEQKKFTTSYLIPYFEKHLPDFRKFKILEVGCAESGLLDILYEQKLEAKGVELEPNRVKLAKEMNPNLQIYTGDITEKKLLTEINDTFDLIIMRDVIEHIPDRKSAFKNIAKLLNNKGYLFITFPPRFSAFAGHQQNGKSFLKYMPYLQLFPNILIKSLGKILNERTHLINFVITNYKIGLSLRKFEELFKEAGFEPIVKDLFFVRPIYKLRYNVNPVKFYNIPLIREFIVTGCECLLKKTEK